MKNEVGVVLRVSGDLANVRAFQVSVDGVQGDVVVRKSEHALSGLPEAWWFTEIILLDQESTSPAFLLLVEKIGADAENIKAAISGRSLLVEIDCTIKNGEGIRIEVPVTCISFAANFLASISFDLY